MKTSNVIVDSVNQKAFSQNPQLGKSVVQSLRTIASHVAVKSKSKETTVATENIAVLVSKRYFI